MRPPRSLLLIPAVVVVLAGCGGDTATPRVDSGASTPAAPPATASQAAGQRYPDIVDVDVTPAGNGTYDLAVTVSSPYDTSQRYADGWRVLAPDGTELGVHTLAHDHAGEQPFTRTQAAVPIPSDVEEITVEGRDQRYGFGGGTVVVPVPHDRR